jgi:D-alanine-D-alanine ligase
VNIGLAYSLREEEPLPNSGNGRHDGPHDDAQEEFDSPETIQALAAALTELGHEVERLGDGEPLLKRLLSGPRPDLVLNIAEGAGNSRSREARVPAVLEMLGVPYTGSDPLALAATLDKDCAKRLVRDAGVATPRWACFVGDWSSIQGELEHLAWPLFVKPAYEGSSKGIREQSLVDQQEDLRATVERLFAAYRQPVLIEEFIDGDELTVGVVGNDPPQVLGIMRIEPTQPQPRFVYDLAVKRDWRRRVRYECPARLEPAVAAAVERAVLACWQALGCRDVARFDFRLRSGEPVFLECNPLPGLSPESGDLVLLARAMEVDYTALVGRIVAAALERQTGARQVVQQHALTPALSQGERED